MPRELAECVERANLDPAVHVIALAGNGKGFCGGYDLVESAEGLAGTRQRRRGRARLAAGSRGHGRQPRPVADRGTRWSTTR